MRHYNAAKASLDSALHVYTRLQDDRGLSEVLMNLGYLEANQQKYSAALALYNQSMQRAQASNYAYGLARSRWGTGDVYTRLGNYKNASLLLDQSEQYCRLAHANELLILNYNTRRDLLAAQQRYKESLLYSMMATALKDSIHRTDLARRFINLEKTQEIEQRDRNIQELQKDKQLAQDKIHLQESRLRQQYILIAAGLICIALLAVVALLYYRFYSRIKVLNIVIMDKNKRIQAQAHKLQDMNAELKHLYQEVSEQNEEIQAQSNKLTESNKSISDLNRNLERIVAEKTQELSTTNEELVRYNNELLQFSYTVSHNLRGPVVRLLGLAGLAQTEQELAQAKQWIDMMVKTAEELDLIIKDLSKVLDLRAMIPTDILNPLTLKKNGNKV
jgi:signal transduction histidine kinase